MAKAEGSVEFAALLEEVGCWRPLQLEGAGIVAEGDEDAVPVFFDNEFESGFDMVIPCCYLQLSGGGVVENAQH